MYRGGNSSYSLLGLRNADAAVKPDYTYLGDYNAQMEIEISTWTPQYSVESLLENDDAVQVDNVTINGVEYMVVEYESLNKIWLFTSRGTVLEPEERSSIKITLENCGIEAAKPLLETFVPKER